MADATICPTTDELRQFAQGELAESAAQLIEEHLKTCRSCVESLKRAASDGSSFVDQRAAGRIGSQRVGAVVEEMGGRLAGTPLDNDTAADAPALPHGDGLKQNDSDTAVYTSAVNQTGIAGLGAERRDLSDQPTVKQASDSDVESLEFLVPPQGPGELGRLGSYRVLRVLGSGGMGIVFEAEDLQLGRSVALKVMKAAVAAGPAARERFQLEARSMAAVKSDHVVTIYQVGEDRGAPYLAMELLHGRSLAWWLAPGRKLDTTEILRLGREVAQGLAAAHERGVIHRDIKPGNIWLEEQSGRVKLLDFGLARAAEQDLHLTTTGMVVGTPAYMSPEQARGDKLDHRADLFSLGVVLYRLCTGELPFHGGTTLAVLSALATQHPTPVRQLAPDAPPELADLTMKLLAKDPADRFATAKDVVAAIEHIQRDTALPPPAGNGHRRGVAGSRRRFRLGVAAALVALLGSLAWFFGPTIVRVVTGKGELIVEVEDPNVEVVVNPEGVRIRPGAEQTLVVTAGEGVVEVRDPKAGWTLVTEKFHLKRGGREVVRVRQQALALARNARGKEMQASKTVDKGKPFVVVHEGERIGYKTFAEALAKRTSGETIEVHGNGPFAVPAAEVSAGGLILRAAPGYRPVFVAQIENGARRPWLAILGGEVVIEGCDFQSDSIFPGWFFDSGAEPTPAAPWIFRNCRFLVNGPRGLISCAAPRLQLEDSLVFAACSEALLSLGPRVDLAMTNNLVHVLGPVVIVAAGHQSVQLTNNHLMGGQTLLRPPLDEAPARPVKILADGNIFAQLHLLGDQGAMPSELITRVQVKWQGNNNLHVRPGGPFVSFSHDKHELKSLSDWNQFWGQLESGSIEWPGVVFQHHAFSWEPADASLRFVRSEAEALATRLSDAARHVGPEWDLVGSGAAYVKAIERTAGTLLPAAKLQPVPPVGGPFVRMTNGDRSDGHATLQSALDAAQEGDTIEVRGEGPYPGAVLEAPQRGGTLTIRAAPGYQPVLESSVHLLLPKTEVQIEGITFAEAHLTGECARLTMRNCAMHCAKEFWTVSCVLREPGQAARFVGCTFNNGPDCRVGHAQSVLFENCVVSRTNVNARPDETDFEVIIRQTLCWAGGLGNGCVACDLNPNSLPRIHAEDSMFVGGGVLTGTARQAHWSGKHNVYSLTGGFAISQQFFTLKSWQDRWNSDLDSMITLSPFLEPRMWRMLPGHPKRPDGKNYGAEVDRVARTEAP